MLFKKVGADAPPYSPYSHSNTVWRNDRGARDYILEVMHKSLLILWP